jgi:hypothetical protein
MLPGMSALGSRGRAASPRCTVGTSLAKLSLIFDVGGNGSRDSFAKLDSNQVRTRTCAEGTARYPQCGRYAAGRTAMTTLSFQTQTCPRL